VGTEPDSKEAWDDAYQKIEDKISDWVHDHYPDPRDATDRIILTSVRGSGQAALLTLGANSAGIVVGRRSLNAILRWFLGSTSISLAQSAKVPVTIVKAQDTLASDSQASDNQASSEERTVEKVLSSVDADSVANASVSRIASGETLQRIEAVTLLHHGETLPIVVGIDGSSDSVRALTFALHAAQRTGRRLHIFFCWQMRDLGVVPGYENAVAPVLEAQKYAESILAKSVSEVDIPEGVRYTTTALHVPAVKGLTSASTYAHWLIVGSRGLSGVDARVLGSVSSQLVEQSHCTLTVVH
jgi:nucleotide-binding universal stress UspA family protein